MICPNGSIITNPNPLLSWRRLFPLDNHKRIARLVVRRASLGEKLGCIMYLVILIAGVNSRHLSASVTRAREDSKKFCYFYLIRWFTSKSPHGIPQNRRQIPTVFVCSLGNSVPVNSTWLMRLFASPSGTHQRGRGFQVLQRQLQNATAYEQGRLARRKLTMARKTMGSASIWVILKRAIRQ
jgi:hypothetical protein